MVKIEQNITQIETKSLERKVGSRVLYTEDDLKFIKDNISSMKLTEMATHLNRNFESMRNKVSKMGLSDRRIYSFKPFTTEDVTFLQENGPKHTLQELAEMTGRTFDSLEKKMRLLNLKAVNPRSFERFTEEQIQFIKENHAGQTNKQLADKLNKSTLSISIKRKKLGLTNPKSKRIFVTQNTVKIEQ